MFFLFVEPLRRYGLAHFAGFGRDEIGERVKAGIAEAAENEQNHEKPDKRWHG
jgi:hypothetical protein